MSNPFAPDGTEQIELDLEPERIIHNGQILHEVPGVYTDEAGPIIPPPKAVHHLPAEVQDIDPEELSGLMAGVISAAMAETPIPSPMEIVNRLLRLKTARGHKAVWTRFDMNQLFALWSNKLDRQRLSRG